MAVASLRRHCLNRRRLAPTLHPSTPVPMTLQGTLNLFYLFYRVYTIISLQLYIIVPGSLQQHHSVLTLVRASGSYHTVRGRHIGALHISVSTASHAQHLNALGRVCCAHSFQTAGQGMQL